LAIPLNKIFINHRMPKRSRSDGSNGSSPNKHLIKLLLNNKSNIHKKLKERETENNKIIHNGINTFYRFRLLKNIEYGSSLETYFNDNNVKLYVIKCENTPNCDNIEIQCYEKIYEYSQEFAQDNQEIYSIEYPYECEKKENLSYYITSSEGFRTNNIELINNGYFNKSGTCFYLIYNIEVFNYINKLFPITISNEKVDLGLIGY